MKNILEVDRLCKRYRGFELKDVSFRIPGGNQIVRSKYLFALIILGLTSVVFIPMMFFSPAAASVRNRSFRSRSSSASPFCSSR